MHMLAIDQQHLIIVGHIEAFEHSNQDALIFLHGRYAYTASPLVHTGADAAARMV